MNTAPAFNEKKYKKLLGETLPGAIHTEEEYDRLATVAHALGEKEAEQDLSPEEDRLADLLATLIQAYQDIHQGDAGDPLQVLPLDFLKASMERRGLKQKDLIPIFGSQGITSEVLSGKRAISKAHAKKLAAFFKVGVECFI